MNFFRTSDRAHYRRWVNLVLSYFLPGSAQYLAGRKLAGIVWLTLYLLAGLGTTIFLLHPRTPYVINANDILWIGLPLWFIIVVDGLRKPIPCMKLRGLMPVLVVYFIILIMPMIVQSFFVHAYQIPSMAMSPTLLGGEETVRDRILANKLIYRFCEPRRGDVIVFETKNIPSLDSDTLFVKRLVGLPGETVSFQPPYLLIDGKRVTDPPLFTRKAEGRDGHHGFAPAEPSTSTNVLFNEISLGPDEYFVLGDFTSNSKDSRYFGPIKRSSIVGKVFYIYAPAGRKRWIE